MSAGRAHDGKRDACGTLMIYLILFIIIAITAFIICHQMKYIPRIFDRNSSDERLKFHHGNLMSVLLGLDETELEKLFALYKKQFGRGAARYAGKTYRKWQRGEVRPIKQTFERFLIQLPKVMSYDLKCEVLRRLMEEYCAKDEYNLEIYTDDWEKTLEPLVAKIIDKPYSVQLPKEIEEKLDWLADGEMQIARDILKKSQVEQGRISVSMLRQEIGNIQNLLAETKGRGKITHQLKFPYGKINLDIKKR